MLECRADEEGVRGRERGKRWEVSDSKCRKREERRGGSEGREEGVERGR